MVASEAPGPASRLAGQANQPILLPPLSIMRYLLLLAAFFTIHAASAQLLNRLKDRAVNAVQSASSGVPSVGGKARQVAGKASGAAENQAADAAGRGTDKQGIIFSKEPLKPGQTTSTTTDFGPTDNIYARVLMATTLYDQLAAQSKEEAPEQVLTVGIGAGSGAPDEYVNLVVLKADYKKTFYDLDVLPAANNAHTKYIGRGNPNDHISFIFTKFGNSTTPSAIPFGKQLFTMEFDGENAPKGSFTLAVTGFPEKRVLDARFVATLKAQASAAAKVARLPDVFKAPGRFSDPQLSAAAIKQKLGAGTMRFAVEPGSVDYTIRKNELGIPQYKIIRPIWTFEKDTDGSCYYTHYYFQRQYEGGGRYGALEIAASTGDKVPIACENTK
ncbi:MAG: hypothetical protein WKG07_35375 [Hymenobacter sp.]